MITEIRFTETFTAPLGLQSASLRELKSLVVLAGPNGAGKSRYLELVKKISDAVVSMHGQRAAHERRLELLQSSTHRPHDYQSTIDSLQTKISELDAAVQIIKQSRESPLKSIQLTYSIEADLSTKLGLSIYGSDPHSSSPQTIDNLVDSNTEGGFKNALKSVYVYFFEVARALHEAEHPRSRGLEEVTSAQADAAAFNKVLRTLLNVEIEPALNKHRRVIAQIRGRPFDPNELSKGEIVLAVWAILLHRQKD